MADKELVITHLQIIHTWSEFARERDLQFFTKKHLEDIAQWSDDAIVLLKEQKDSIRILISDLEDLQKEHDKLLDKTIPLITNGQEVVRCKDCKHWSEEFDRNCLKRSGWFRTTPDWFCADAEHKEGR